jgi:DNA-binding response OmpR family regulator
MGVSSGTVWQGDDELDLSELSFRLLATLASRAPAMVDKDELSAIRLFARYQWSPDVVNTAANPPP